MADKQGFSYRSLVGKLMYASVPCSDIGYHVTKLSKFSTAPAAIHYTMPSIVDQTVHRQSPFSDAHMSVVKMDLALSYARLPFYAT